MIKIIRFDYAKFEQPYIKNMEIWAEHRCSTFDEKEAYINGIKTALKNFKECLESTCEREENIKVSIFDYDTFYRNQESEFMINLKKYPSVVEQHAYVVGIHRILADLKSELVKSLSKDGFVRDKDMKEPLKEICLIWK